MIKLICLSDPHGDHAKVKVPDGNILIIAGDIERVSYQSELEQFNNWLGGLPHKYKIVIAGNHDEFCSKHVVDKLLTNAIYLQNYDITIEGIKFWGSPISPTFLSWFFMKERGDEIRKVWKLIPKDTEILIVHGAPYKILDKVYYPSGRMEHAGCWDLRDIIEHDLKDLRLCIFGHLHSNYGVEKIGKVTYVNASVMNEEYEVVNSPIIINYDEVNNKVVSVER